MSEGHASARVESLRDVVVEHKKLAIAHVRVTIGVVLHDQVFHVATQPDELRPRARERRQVEYLMTLAENVESTGPNAFGNVRSVEESAESRAQRLN